jgi:tetratricopeptide (TPR) repeat protein
MPFNKAKSLREAERFLAEGKISQAIRCYLDVFQQVPSDVALLNTMGDLFVRDRNVAEGLKYFHRLADAYVREGSTLKAIAIYKKIIKLDTENAAPRARLAAVCEAAGRPEEATRLYLETTQLALRSGDKGAAQKALQRAGELDPDNPEVLALRQAMGVPGMPAAPGPGERDGAAELPPAGDSERLPVGPVVPLNLPDDPAPQASSAPPPSPFPETIDLSDDWESFLAGAPAAPPAPAEAASFIYDDSCTEVHFYVEHGLMEEARRAVEELVRTRPGEAGIAELRALVEEQIRMRCGAVSLNDTTVKPQSP